MAILEILGFEGIILYRMVPVSYVYSGNMCQYLRTEVKELSFDVNFENVACL